MNRKIVSGIMLTLILISILTLMFNVPLAHNTDASTYISTDTIWTLSGSPYIVGDVIVENGATLTIEAGVVVKFTTGTSLVVDGSLIAQGNSTHKITFTSNSTATSQWQGIQVRSSAEYTSFDHCIVEYAKTAIHFGGREVRYAFGTVTNSIIRSCETGIFASVIPPCRIIIENTTISGNHNKGLDAFATLNVRNSAIYGNGHGILHYEGLITVENCVILKNHGWGIYSEAVVAPSYVKNSIVSYNEFGIAGIDLVQYTVISRNRPIYIPHVPKTPYAVKYCKEVSNCTIVHNEGFGAYDCNRILHSVIANNTEGGCKPTGSGDIDGKISGCIISQNSGIGVRVGWLDSLTIDKCNITNNMGVGVRDEGRADIDVNYCNIFGNVDYDFQKHPQIGMGGDEDSDATNNWWGTVNESIIEEHLYDYYDDYNKGKIFYKPYLTEPEVIPYPSCPSEPDFIPPSISNVQMTPATPNYDEEGIVSATITDNVKVDQVFLSYTHDLAWRNVSMNRFGDEFNATIPTQPYETSVSYKIYANDTNGNWAESDTFAYTVVPEFPSFLILPLFMVITLLAVILYRRKHSVLASFY